MVHQVVPEIVNNTNDISIELKVYSEDSLIEGALPLILSLLQFHQPGHLKIFSILKKFDSSNAKMCLCCCCELLGVGDLLNFLRKNVQPWFAQKKPAECGLQLFVGICWGWSRWKSSQALSKTPRKSLHHEWKTWLNKTC